MRVSKWHHKTNPNEPPADKETDPRFRAGGKARRFAKAKVAGK